MFQVLNVNAIRSMLKSRCNIFLLLLSLIPAHTLAATISVDFETYPDGTPIPGLTPITTQFASQGVIFSGFDNPVYAGAVFFGNGSSTRGLTHSIVNPFPSGMNGIIATFNDPISFLSVDIHAGRIGAIANMQLIGTQNQTLDTLSFSAADFYKGHFEQDLLAPVKKVIWLSSVPNDDLVGIRNLSFNPVPLPSGAILFLSGLTGFVAFVRKRT